MADKAREWTDKELARMEKKIDKTYKQASKELTKKWDEYMKRGESRISALRSAYAEAKQSGDKESIIDARNRLSDALQNFTLRNDQYKAMVESVTLDMAQVNQQALSYINGQLPNVYAENHDQVKVDLNNVKVDYTLADKGTVKRMIKDGDIKLPKKKISVPKDVAWNTKKINSSVLQGILQGESMDKIAKRLLPIMDSNRTSAIRNARTLVTGAENRGRIDSYHELADQGIILKKVWIATGDDRTRDAHLVMDGQEVDIDENFVDGDGNELEYPADPSGEPATVYNCRCSMRTHIVGVQNEDGTIDYIDYEHEEGLHQEQIEEEIERRNQEEPTEPIELIEPQEPVEEPKQREPVEVEKLKNIMSEDNYNEFMGMVTNADSVDLWDKYAKDVRNVQVMTSGGHYSPMSDTVVFSYDHGSYEGINKYSTLAHEFNHAFDHKIGAGDWISFNEVDKINEACPIGTGIFNMIDPKPSNSDEFLSALRKDMDNLKSRGLSEVYQEFKETNERRNATGGVQDALDGFFSTQKKYAGWGHGDSYYNRGYNHRVKGFGQDKNLKSALNELGFDASNQTKVKNIYRQYESASEAWANVGSAVAVGGAELDAMKTYMPNTLEAYKNIVGGVK